MTDAFLNEEMPLLFYEARIYMYPLKKKEMVYFIGQTYINIFHSTREISRSGLWVSMAVYTYISKCSYSMCDKMIDISEKNM